MNKVVSIEQALESIKDGASIMVGGFMGCGTPHKLVDALVKKNVKDLTIICNDGGVPDFGIAKLISNNQVKKLIATHVGLNPEVGTRMNDGTMEVVLIPQGTLAEQIRAGGSGLGGVLTPTGVGTIIADEKKVVEISGKKYLYAEPIKSDFALIVGNIIDTKGNVWYKGTTRNFNVVMATAAQTVIAEADNLVACGEIEPENVVTLGVFVDYIVDGGAI